MARRAAQPRLDDPPRPREKTQASCGVPSCTREATATCAWQMHEVNAEGERVYTGKLCGMKLCDRHGVRVGPNKVLCAWHNVRAREQGLV
jgi:hypothetical protein